MDAYNAELIIEQGILATTYPNKRTRPLIMLMETCVKARI